ncbi:MAG: HIT family protein [Actinobacteria bacterium]|nr:HIT family protein [Actinomycetota bacterium]
MASVFTKIIDGDLPGTFVHRDELAVAIMTINPINTGHALVIPRVEIDRWTDLPIEVAHHLVTLAHRIGNAQIRAFGCQRAALIIAGFEVPHVHLHVIPADSLDHVSFENAARTVDPADLASAAQRISQHL